MRDRMPKQRFRVLIEADEDGGWVAQCVEIPGAISQGETLKEVTANVADAIAEVLAYRSEAARQAVKGSSSKSARLRTVEVRV